MSAREGSGASDIERKRSEIARRHRRGRPKETEAERLKSVCRAQVKRLLRHRHGCILPNDHEGRAGLQVLLELALTGPEALRLAPWCVQELERLISLADRNAEARIATIADRLEVDSTEFKELALWNLGRPFGMSPEELVAFRKGRRRERNRDRMRRERAKQAAARSSAAPAAQQTSNSPADVAQDLSDRARWLLRVLPVHWSITVRHLAERVQCLESPFDQLDRSALITALHRAIRELKKAGIAETKSRPSRNGLDELMVSRRMTPEEEQSELLEELAAENSAADE
jgi:hypothetical protein